MLVHPDNWNAFIAFTKAQTQWELDNKGRRYGLNYQGAQVCWRLLKLKITPKDFEKIQACEQATRESV